MTTETATRETMIVCITEWAARYGAMLQLAGEVGFMRECVGVIKGEHYIDTTDIKDQEAYVEGGEWWQPEDAYHKHDCMAVLGRGDAALAQLYEWVRWLDGHGYGIKEVPRQPSSQIDLLFHGVSMPSLVKLESPQDPRQG